MKQYVYTYSYKGLYPGCRYTFYLYAESDDDAEDRLQAIKSTAQLEGVVEERGAIDLSGMDRFLDDMKREKGMDEE